MTLIDCVIWPTSKNKDGYGTVSLKGKMNLVHRVVYEILNGPIPTGLYVLHKCDNPPCFTGHHLFLGTQNDNMKDMAKKGRSKKGKLYQTYCKHGHKFEVTTTYIRPEGTRECLICRKLYMKKYYRRVSQQ